MCELISICPKCRQPILCATAQFGKCVACPVCLQEVTMPESSVASYAMTPDSHPAASAPRLPAPVGKQGVWSSAVNAGGVVLVFAAGIGIWALKTARSTTRAPSSFFASATLHPTLPPSISCPSRYSFLIKSGTIIGRKANHCTAVQDPLSWSAPSGNCFYVPASKIPFQDAPQP